MKSRNHGKRLSLRWIVGSEQPKRSCTSAKHASGCSLKTSGEEKEKKELEGEIEEKEEEGRGKEGEKRKKRGERRR